MTKTKKMRLSQSREYGAESIIALQHEGFKVERLSPFQWRINNRLDLFPTNRKYHDVIRNERGSYIGAADICRKILFAGSR